MFALAVRLTLLAVALTTTSALSADEPAKSNPTKAPVADVKPPAAAAKEAKPTVYDEQADPQQQINAATRIARHHNQRVLLSFGGNWCGWCIKLHKLFDENKEIAELLDEEFVVGWIDSAKLDQVTSFGDKVREQIGKHGVPFLVVLDADGKVLTLQDTGSLEAGPLHDIEKVKAFLKTWTAPPVDAEKLLAEAKSRAKAADKRVFVQVGSSGCGWCHRLEDFVTDHSALFEPDYVYLKINVSRMTGGEEIAKRLGCDSKGGVPWSAIVDAEGKVLTTSDSPKGNIGYPFEPEEIEHFIAMLNKSAQHNTPAQIAEIKQALEKTADELRSSLKR
jgi:thioredoxin-related protein